MKRSHSNGHLRFGLLLGCSSELLRVRLSALPDSFLKGLYSLAVEGVGKGVGQRDGVMPTNIAVTLKAE